MEKIPGSTPRKETAHQIPSSPQGAKEKAILDGLEFRNEIEANLSHYVHALDPGILGREDTAGPQILQLAGGHHNANYTLSFADSPDRKYVLRFNPNGQQDRDMIALEYERLQGLPPSIAPWPLHLGKADSIAGSILVLEFIGGEHRQYAGMDPADISVLAIALARLHGITSTTFSAFPGDPQTSGTLLDFARSSMAQWISEPLEHIRMDSFPESINPIDQGKRLLEDRINQNQGAFASTEFGLLHGDPGPENALWHDGKVTLIDWTESVFGDPADELAALFAVNHVSPEFKGAFLAGYAARRQDPTLDQRIGVYTLKARLADLIWSMQQLERETSGTQSELVRMGSDAYAGYYQVRLKALREELGLAG